ncbi:uncharacterized protein LOC131310383 [Rhododendron vialii]|uniref:uncharacterized protein LOC131310383 n=1 Tax=Rhododendron vialii TaxID=182163 RepID=UPI00265F99CC|nr:uncharacterized protein LOC131310383 [Rhododendron vialii]
MEIWHLVVVAVVTVIVEGVMHLIFYALWGFVSPKLGRLWLQLAHQKEPQTPPVLLLDQGREVNMKLIQSVMKVLFPNPKTVRLRGNHNKYLCAGEDEISVTQDESGSSENVCWTVEFCSESEDKIRLRSCYGKYLTASNKRFLLGLTGRKVLQMAGCLDSSVEWQPIQEGNWVKFKTRDGSFLRANGGVPPWQDSVTHDGPWVLQDLVLWDVDEVEIVSEQLPQPGVQLESSGSWSSLKSNYRRNSLSLVRQEIQTVMNLFSNAKAVRLRSNHKKYLYAEEDEISVTQDESGSSKNVCWTVEFSSESEDKIRLKSCYGKYLTASNKRSLLGLTGCKVLQMAGCLNLSVEWQPIQEGNRVKLRTRDGNFLRANGGDAPWWDSVTHDIPWVLQDLVLWDVDVVEIVSEQSPQLSIRLESSKFGSSSGSNHRHKSPSFVRQENNAENALHYSMSQKIIVPSNNKIQTAMKLFYNAKAVRLRGNHNKYLWAEGDEISVTQDESGFSKNVRWTVEFSSESENKIRLKSCYGKYLTASNERFLLGWTGRKVLQMAGCLDSSVEWQPIQEGNRVKLRTRDGNFLRANGGIPPWLDSVTHDVPWVLQDLVLWNIDEVDIVSEQSPLPKPGIQFKSSESGSSSELNHRRKSSSSVRQENNAEKSKSQTSRTPSNNKIQSVMELFRNAKTVRLRGKHKKYLSAKEDEKTVTQDESGFLKNACWTVEFSSESENKIRLKSCYGKYLTASNKRSLGSVAGRKVLQTASCLDSSVDWQLIQKGNKVKLRTRDGKFLRANGGIPPWRDSVTHDIPNRTATQDWVLWNVDVVEIVSEDSEQSSQPKPNVQLESESSSESNHRHHFPNIVRQESNDSEGSSESKGTDGRVIYYSIEDEYSNVDEDLKELSFMFKGNGVQELTKRLEEETGLEDIRVCSRSSMNMLYTLRSKFPPNNVDMHVVVVPSSLRAE